MSQRPTTTWSPHAWAELSPGGIVTCSKCGTVYSALHQGMRCEPAKPPLTFVELRGGTAESVALPMRYVMLEAFDAMVKEFDSFRRAMTDDGAVGPTTRLSVEREFVLHNRDMRFRLVVSNMVDDRE